MWAPHPDVFTMTASAPAASNVSIVRRAISTARAWSPPWAFRAPQQPWPAGATTSQPFFASTRAVARLWAPKTTDCTQPVSSATRARRGPSAGVSVGSGDALGSRRDRRQERFPRRQRSGQEPDETGAPDESLQTARLVEPRRRRGERPAAAGGPAAARNSASGRAGASARRAAGARSRPWPPR